MAVVVVFHSTPYAQSGRKSRELGHADPLAQGDVESMVAPY